MFILLVSYVANINKIKTDTSTVTIAGINSSSHYRLLLVLTTPLRTGSITPAVVGSSTCSTSTLLITSTGSITPAVVGSSTCLTSRGSSNDH